MLASLVDANSIMEVALFSSDNLPGLLPQINDLPKLLSVYSENNEVFSSKRILAVAGTRQPTYLAENLCKQIVEWAKDVDVVLVTGLAYGVDQLINNYAVQLGVKTIGVLAQPIPDSQNLTGIHKKMIALGGALVSEVQKDNGWGKYLYIKRNRIIAGLAPATLIVQAGKPSGSLHTADFAADYNREVFTFPGLPLMPEYAGNNWLIKNHKAQAIEHIYELGVQIGWTDNKNLEQKLNGQIEIEPFQNYLPPYAAKVYNILRERALGLPAICDIMQVDYREIQQAVYFLQMMRLIRPNSRQNYEISNSRIASQG